MSDTTDNTSGKEPSLLGWWLLFLAGVVFSIALAYVLVNDRNQAEMHKGEGKTIAGPKSGH
ncbi:hypothetical protein [Phenylobacterium immobile]|uniref:hypothetical protein n=1 Tax=Phenylobacterium immobile TaxID=21 RepID=UPI000AAE93EE|nr:hypothetical protein [Phenylobacterium immobile]